MTPDYVPRLREAANAPVTHGGGCGMPPMAVVAQADLTAALDELEHLRGGQPTAEAVPSCGKCRRPFDPADRSFDGAAEDRTMSGFCRGCVDNCHEAGVGHRCAVCKSLDAQTGGGS